ncbi:cation diffusion facilitator family transporter [Desulfosarcina ovata]|uniref:Cation transporter n=1 Tax=Desulfosarcina ovata subsp. ovata TaxID=2752305 RepID=A0A5K8A495_9BACT|nr:cation diffusion facilitator family transporter [Desulfosarcina ovata]BBO87362.1 cation transporter [Desulfosarcina ovata subsp. ovata]
MRTQSDPKPFISIQFKRRMRAITSSLIVATGLMAAKFYSYHLTHSSAVLSDALESIINVVAAAFAMVSIWMAAQPPDPEHPYGHGKIEYFSAGFEGALIILAAIGIFKTGIDQLMFPHPLANLNAGLLVLVAASAANLGLGIILIRIGNRVQSLTLVADGKHVLTDVYTSGGVVAGLILVQWTGWMWLDGSIACLVGVNILLTGTRLVGQSFSALMDASDPMLLDRITQLIITHRHPHWIDIHQLRAWRSGNFVHIDLHLVLPRQYQIDDAHADAKVLEQMLIDHFDGNAGVLVHIDPCQEDDCPVCRKYRCEQRKKPFNNTRAWDRESLTANKSDGLASPPEKTAPDTGEKGNGDV